MDARHHPFDVLFGSALGILVAWAAYRQYFPPVSNSSAKGRAYPIRTWGKQMRVLDGPQADVALEPFRQPSAVPSQPVDTEQNAGAGGNVFRDQIARSQRQRQGGQPSGFQPTTGSSSSYARQRDQSWSQSSSGDEAADFEMQPQYQLTDSQSKSAPLAATQQPTEEIDYEEYRSQTRDTAIASVR